MQTATRKTGRISGVNLARRLAASSVLAACGAVFVPGCTIPIDHPNGHGPGDLAGDGKDYRDPVVLAALRERAVSVIESGVRSPDAEVRANSIEAASKLPARMENLVALGLADANEGVRTVAVMSVGRSKIDRLTPAVESLRDDPSPFVRAATIFALAKNGRDVDQTPLAGMLTGEWPTRVRSHVAFVLGELGNPSAAPMIRSAARQSRGRATNAGLADVQLMHLQFAEAIVKLSGDESSLESLRAALYPSRPEELEATALSVQILGQVRDRKSVDNLIYLASYKDEAGNLLPAEVRLAVAGALARIGMPQGGFIADEYWTSEIPAIRAQSAFVYGVTGSPQSLGRLDAMLDDPDARVRISAAAAVLTRNEDARAGG